MSLRAAWCLLCSSLSANRSLSMQWCRSMASCLSSSNRFASSTICTFASPFAAIASACNSATSRALISALICLMSALLCAVTSAASWSAAAFSLYSVCVRICSVSVVSRSRVISFAALPTLPFTSARSVSNWMIRTSASLATRIWVSRARTRRSFASAALCATASAVTSASSLARFAAARASLTCFAKDRRSARRPCSSLETVGSGLGAHSSGVDDKCGAPSDGPRAQSFSSSSSTSLLPVSSTHAPLKYCLGAGVRGPDGGAPELGVGTACTGALDGRCLPPLKPVSCFADAAAGLDDADAALADSGLPITPDDAMRSARAVWRLTTRVRISFCLRLAFVYVLRTAPPGSEPH
mmetsp:Transcript_1902/g.4321  ORF Transcript_1902/g.4321 Transcript_1902/m.4321 type:complete len:354 (+) Transcript_1902:73-1134(+)